MNIRIDKLLASKGYGSRKDIKRLLREHIFCVNSIRCVDTSTHVSPETDIFTLDTVSLIFDNHTYLMLNKPKGVVTSNCDPMHRTVMDLLQPPYSQMKLFSIGRLDYDTEGLLIITDDGTLTHRLTSPKTGIMKKYEVSLKNPISQQEYFDYQQQMKRGVTFHDGYTCLPALLESRQVEETIYNLSITIQEGKYHQVKKMFKVVKNEVAYLKRVKMGDLELDPNLECGSFRPLTKDEIYLLRYSKEHSFCGESIE